MGIKDFARATLKLAIALFVAGILIVAAIWAAVAIKERAEKSEAKQYEVVKTWPIETNKALQMEKISVRTKLVDGRILANVEITGFPEYLSHPALGPKNRDKFLILSFDDADKFKVYEKALKISDFTANVDSTGKRMGLEYQFEESVSTGKYKSFARAVMGWNLETEIPVAKPSPASKEERPHADPCAPNIARAERLRRLALYGEIRQSSTDTFTAGNREVAFHAPILGGGLLYCR